MGILIFALIVLIVAALFIYAAQQVSLGTPFDALVRVLIVVIAALLILNRAGVV